MSWCSHVLAAIVAFLLLFATFAVGLRCFADFDKGLQSSKTHGQSYRPVATKLTKLDLFGDYSFSSDRYHYAEKEILLIRSCVSQNRSRRRRRGRHADAVQRRRPAAAAHIDRVRRTRTACIENEDSDDLDDSTATAMAARRWRHADVSSCPIPSLCWILGYNGPFAHNLVNLYLLSFDFRFHEDTARVVLGASCNG